MTKIKIQCNALPVGVKFVHNNMSDRRFSSSSSTPPSPKKPLKERIKDEFYHYYYGTRLFLYDVRVASRHIRKVFNGKNLTSREKLQLRRTIVDMFRIVPFIALILIPFSEVALPFIIKLFPGFLPSTYQGHRTKADILKQKLWMDLEYRSALYLEIDKYHLSRKSDKSSSFAILMDEVRAGRKKLTHNELIKFSKYITEDDLTDILTVDEFRNLFSNVWKSDGPIDDSYIDEMTEDKLHEIEMSDLKLVKLLSTGFESMSLANLTTECQLRGIETQDIEKSVLIEKLHRWVDYSVNKKVPVMFLLITKVAESDDSQYVTNIIKNIPERILNEIEINIAEEEGEKLSNETMYDIIKHEEELIKMENTEVKKLK